MHKLTSRQQTVLSFIRDFIETERMPPTRAEIASALGFRSVNAAEDHLKALVRKGDTSKWTIGGSRVFKYLGALPDLGHENGLAGPCASGRRVFTVGSRA